MKGFQTYSEDIMENVHRLFIVLLAVVAMVCGQRPIGVGKPVRPDTYSIGRSSPIVVVLLPSDSSLKDIPLGNGPCGGTKPCR